MIILKIILKILNIFTQFSTRSILLVHDVKILKEWRSHRCWLSHPPRIARVLQLGGNECSVNFQRIYAIQTIKDDFSICTYDQVKFYEQLRFYKRLACSKKRIWFNIRHLCIRPLVKPTRQVSVPLLSAAARRVLFWISVILT